MLRILMMNTQTHFICFYLKRKKNFEVWCKVMGGKSALEKLGKQKHSRKKNDPADALTVADIFVVSEQLLLFLVSLCFRRNSRDSEREFFSVFSSMMLFYDDFIVYGHKHRWRVFFMLS